MTKGILSVVFITMFLKLRIGQLAHCQNSIKQHGEITKIEAFLTETDIFDISNC